MPGHLGLVTLDLSDARVQLLITGASTAGLLMCVLPVDMALAALPVGTFVQTGLHHIGVLVERLADDRFAVMILRSWAESVHEVLTFTYCRLRAGQ